MRLLVGCIVALMLLAGCSDKKPDGADDSSRSSTSPTAAPAPNHPPTASMLANTTGQAPLNVTFLLNGTDADGDAVTWTLDFGDASAAANGTALPGNVTHLYAAAGLFNATLLVSDGNATTNATLTLNITAGSAFQQFVAAGTPDLPCAQCSNAGANTGLGYRAGINELDSFFVEIPADSAGQPFTVASTAGDPDMVFRDGCEGGAAVGDAFQADGPEAGTVPEGALCALMWEPLDGGSTITLTIG